jgi:hypothetical protein
MSLLYLAYGSNLHPGRLRERTPSAQLIGTTELTGWQLCFHKRSNNDGSAKCNITAGNGSVQAAVFELSHRDEPLLDRVEGFGKGYDKAVVDIPEFGKAFAYLAAPTHIDDKLRPFSWYKALVLAGCAFHGFSKQYIRTIDQVPHIEDRDPLRHDHHMLLVGALRSETRQA